MTYNYKFKDNYIVKKIDAYVKVLNYSKQQLKIMNKDKH